MSALLCGLVDLAPLLVLNVIKRRVCESVVIHGRIEYPHTVLQLLAPCPHEIAVHQNFLDVLCRLLDARDLLTLLRRCHRVVAFRDGRPRAVLAICNDLREIFQGV